jgi:hypothetical protein
MGRAQNRGHKGIRHEGIRHQACASRPAAYGHRAYGMAECLHNHIVHAHAHTHNNSRRACAQPLHNKTRNITTCITQTPQPLKSCCYLCCLECCRRAAAAARCPPCAAECSGSLAHAYIRDTCLRMYTQVQYMHDKHLKPQGYAVTFAAVSAVASAAAAARCPPCTAK